MANRLAEGGLGVEARPHFLRIHTFSSLKYRDFRLLWFGSLFATAGNWIQQVTLGWLIYEMTGSAFMVGALQGVRAIPYLLASPLGGVLGDRMDRRRLLIASELFLGVLSFGFAALVSSGRAEVWHLFAFTVLSGIGWAATNPVRQALVADTVPHESLLNAVALNSAAFNFNRMAGPAVGGVLIAFFGPGTNFFIQAACYTSVALVALPMRIRQRDTAAARRASPLTTLRDGLRYVAKDQTILALILIAMIPAIFIFPFTSGLMPVFAKDVLHAGPEGLGLLLAVLGVGGLLGALTVATLGRVRRPGLVQLVAGVVSGLGMVIFSQAHSIAFAVPFLILVGTTQMLFNAINNTTLQMITPDAYRGRVMSFYMMNLGLTPVGGLIAGTMAQFMGSPASVLIGGILTVGLVVLASIRFRTMRSGT